MSSENLLPPSAPPAENERRLYPSLPETTNAENFRLTEISRIEKEISAEVEHYRLVLKIYKKVRKALHYSVVGLGAVTAALSSGAVATSLTVCWNCCRRACCWDSRFIWRSFHWPVRCQQEA